MTYLKQVSLAMAVVLALAGCGSTLDCVLKGRPTPPPAAPTEVAPSSE